MESRRHRPVGGSARSPRLTRSKSGSASAATSLPKHSTLTPVHRSTSTTKSRSRAGGRDHSISSSALTTPTSQKRVTTEDKNNDGKLVPFLQHNNGNVQKRSARLTPTSPSAWALSPARVSPFSPASPMSCPSTSNSSSFGGILKYFRNKKVASIQQVEYRQFRVLHNNLLQWRYGNARAEAAMSNVKIIAEKKLFNVWLRILTKRNSILEKRSHAQRLKQTVKLYQLLCSQDCFLKEWAKMETKNSEAVGRVIRKLSAMSIRVPLADDAKGDLLPVKEALETATVAMDRIEETVTKFDYEVERTCYLMTELVIIVKQNKEYMEELQKCVALITSLKAEEKSLRIQLIQLKENSTNRQRRKV